MLRRRMVLALYGFFLAIAKKVDLLARPAVDYLRYKIALGSLYKARGDDIFVVTFPKSGSTLMQMMLYQLTTDGSMDFPHIEMVSPWFERHLSKDNHEFLDLLPSPRVFKSHLYYSDIPHHGKCIYVARDVRDVAVSAYHHHRLMTGMEASLTNFLGQFIKDRSGFGSWFEHIKSWWPHRNDPNVLFLRFEEVVADLPAAIVKVANFLGIGIDGVDLSRIQRRCSLSFMKENWEKFDPRLSQFNSVNEEFIRRGKGGGGRSALDAEQEALVADRLRDLARKLGRRAGESFRELFLPCQDVEDGGD